MKIILVSLMLLISCTDFSISLTIEEKRLVQIDRLVNSHIKHTMKIIESKNGEVIDCVPLDKQPAFSHPSLKNHKIQMEPSSNIFSAKSTVFNNGLKQVWHKYGSCPVGTIPIRRANATVFAKSKLPIEHFGKKPEHHQILQKASGGKDIIPTYRNTSRAFTFTAGYAYNGGTANMQVCTPHVQFDDEYSLANVAAVNGEGNNLEQVETGWAVHPSLYGDRETHFFIYFKVATDKSISGCFDLTCPGFIQTSNRIALGGAIHTNKIPKSGSVDGAVHTNGIPYPGGLGSYIAVWLVRDVYTKNWWVWTGNDQHPLGYYPAELFDLLSYLANAIQWGGEVGSSRIKDVKPHTETDMGDGWKDDTIMQNVKVRENRNDWILPDPTSNIADELGCYSVTYRNDLAEPLVLYGGSGKYCSPIVKGKNKHQ